MFIKRRKRKAKKGSDGVVLLEKSLQITKIQMMNIFNLTEIEKDQ